MGILADEFTSKLVRDKEIKAHLKVRSSAYIFETVDKRLLDDYDPAIWTEHKEGKRSVILKKQKPHHAIFEDRVWSILARMGFSTLNNKGFRLPYVEDESIPGKQIDAFAADDETIIVVECKSAEAMKKAHFSKEINEYDKVIAGGNRVLKKAFSDKHKIRYIFATNNINLSDNDRTRLRELQMFHFNQDDINYYEQLLQRVGSAAKYQLLARLFEDIDIPAFENKIPAIRGQLGKNNYYSFSIEPEKLLKISYILHRVNTNDSLRGYQRLVKPNRLKEIEQFINGGGFFPNSIIININTKKETPLNFDKVSCTHNSKITEPVILHLPKKYHSAFIIDGQHRLYGYAGSKFRKNNNAIPVVAFENLPADEQIKLFRQINSKQKPVSKNLLTTIGAELMWNSKKYDEGLSAFMSKLLQELGDKDNSPLYGCIILGDKNKTVKTCVTLDTIITYGLKKGSFFAKLNKKHVESTGHLWIEPNTSEETDYTPMLAKSFQFFRTYFEHIKEQTEDIWNLGSAPGGFVAMNIGVLCFIRVASDILDHIKKYEHEDFSKKNGREIAELTFRYIEPIIEHIKTFDAQRIAQFRKNGSNAAGVEYAVREFQREVHNRFTDFAPDGLAKWITDNSGKFNDATRTATERFEIGIKDKLYAVLEEKFGASWWKDGVPPEIRKAAATTKIDEDSEEPESEFLHLIDYKKVASRNWEICSPVFADPSIKRNKDEQLKWFDKLNPIRNKVAHNRKITEEDFEFIKQLNEWLPERLGFEKLPL